MLWMQVPITYCPVPFYKSATDPTVVVRFGCVSSYRQRYIKLIARKMPVVLPHDLVAALCEAGIWPDQIGKMRNLFEWWVHNEKHNNWYCDHPAFEDKKHEPLCLYGDDACLTKAGNEKMTVITLSHCLDTRSDSTLTSWPLCLFRCVP